MTGYNYTERSVHPLHDWLQLQVSALFMGGNNSPQRSVHSLHDWLQLH